MSLQASTQDLVFTQMMRVAAAASLAALLARFAVFRRAVFAARRTPRQNLELMAMLALPFALGVTLRMFHYNFADMTLAGSLLIGLVGGRLAGPIGGVIISLPAYAHHEWMAMPVAVVSGLLGGLIETGLDANLTLLLDAALDGPEPPTRAYTVAGRPARGPDGPRCVTSGSHRPSIRPTGRIGHR